MVRNSPRSRRAWSREKGEREGKYVRTLAGIIWIDFPLSYTLVDEYRRVHVYTRRTRSLVMDGVCIVISRGVSVSVYTLNERTIMFTYLLSNAQS